MSRKLNSLGTHWTKRELRIAKNADLTIEEKLNQLPGRSKDALNWQINKRNYRIIKKKVNFITEKSSVLTKPKMMKLTFNGIPFNLPSNVKCVTVKEEEILITT